MPTALEEAALQKEEARAVLTQHRVSVVLNGHTLIIPGNWRPEIIRAAILSLEDPSTVKELTYNDGEHTAEVLRFCPKLPRLAVINLNGSSFAEKDLTFLPLVELPDLQTLLCEGCTNMAMKTIATLESKSLRKLNLRETPLSPQIAQKFKVKLPALRELAMEEEGKQKQKARNVLAQRGISVELDMGTLSIPGNWKPELIFAAILSLEDPSCVRELIYRSGEHTAEMLFLCPMLPGLTVMTLSFSSFAEKDLTFQPLAELKSLGILHCHSGKGLTMGKLGTLESDSLIQLNLHETALSPPIQRLKAKLPKLVQLGIDRDSSYLEYRAELSAEPSPKP